jgi:hypothetical protein
MEAAAALVAPAAAATAPGSPAVLPLRLPACLHSGVVIRRQEQCMAELGPPCTGARPHKHLARSFPSPPCPSHPKISPAFGMHLMSCLAVSPLPRPCSCQTTPWSPPPSRIPPPPRLQRLPLPPLTSMVSALGPMNTIPSSSQRRAKVVFSLRKPYPGWMASTSASLAILMMPSTSR